MMAHKETLKKKQYKNWVLSGLGLKYVKEGLAPFVTQKIQRQHESFVGGLTNSCSSCCIKDLLPAHAASVSRSCCKDWKRCQCIGSKRTYRSHCPNGVCDKIYDAIMCHHCFQEPNWFNTDIRKWTSEPWEIAKCFINTRGNEDSTSADDTDCSGLLSIIINNTVFSALDKLQYNEVRDLRNKIMHSPNMEITDDELRKNITNMVSILEEPELQNDKDAKAGLQKLKELQENDIFISLSDEIELLKDALNAIKEKQSSLERGQTEHRKEIRDIATKHADMVASQRTVDIDIESMKRQLKDQTQFHDKIQIVNDKINDIESEMSHYTDDQSRLSLIVNDLKSVVETLQRETAVSNEGNRKQFDLMQSNMKSLEDKITRVTENSSRNNEEANTRLQYLEKKKDLQKMLITTYEDNCSSVLVSPVRDELRTNIDDVFVDLVLCDDVLHKKVQEGVRWEGDEVAVELYKDIFYKENKLCKNMYMLGDAGMGKTTWCTKLLRTWICAQKKMSEGSIVTQDLDEDQKCMLNFDIVAFIPLRHATDDSLILDMIENQLFSEIPEMQSIFLDVLKAEPSKCLVVLDGLDEWSKPPGKKFAFSQNQHTPGRKQTHGCPVLTTSRPWKIYSIDLKESEIDRAVKLKGIKDRDLMAAKMIKKLNNLLYDQDPKNYEDFDKCFKGFQDLNEIASLPFDNKLPLSDFMNVPLILVIMVGLWFESGRIETSYAGNYWAMVGYLIQYTETQKEIKQYQEKTAHHSILKNCPATVRGHVHKYMCLITKLSKFAFDTVFEHGLNNYLVFDENKLKKVLSKEEVRVAVQLGILSQSKALGKAMSRMTSLSFLHKSLQEFFAAMHIVISTQNGKMDAIKKFENYCSDVVKLAEMENIVMFVCGLDPKLASRISLLIATLEVSKTRGNEYDNWYMYLTYNLPLKCAMQVHAIDPDYPSKEFPIHTKHVYIENSEQYRPILSFMFSILKANIGNINTVAINTGIMHTNSDENHSEYIHYMKRSSLAQEQTNALSLPSVLLKHSELPTHLTDCTLYGLDLSVYSDSDLKKVEKSLRGLRNIEILNIGKIRGFESLHLNLSNCHALAFFSLKEMINTHVDLNFRKLEMVSLEKGIKCRIDLTGKIKGTCMNETYQKDSKLCIIARKMVECDVTICFSCFLADRLVVESCLKHSIDFKVHKMCAHPTITINTFEFENNKLCSIKGKEEMIVDDVSIRAEKGNFLDIPVEQIVEHAKSISVQLCELQDFIFNSSRIEKLEIKLSANGRKDLEIINGNIYKLFLLRSLKIHADKFDPTRVFTPKLTKLNDAEIHISEENFSRNAWKSLFEIFRHRQTSWRLKVNDSENRSIACTKDEEENIDIHCTHLQHQDLKSIFSIIDNQFEANHIKRLEIQANTVDISIFRTIQKLSLLNNLKINLSNELVTPTKSIELAGSTCDSLQTFSCRNISSDDLKYVVNSLSARSSLNHIEALETFTLEREEMDESVYTTISKVKRVKNITLRISKGYASQAADQRIVDYLMSVDIPGCSSFYVQVGDKKLLKLNCDTLECQNFSERTLSSILSFVARPYRYQCLLTTLEVHSRKIDTQCLVPVALLKELTSLKLTLTSNVFHDKLLEMLHTTLKKLPQLRNLDINDGSLKYMFHADEPSFVYVRDTTCKVKAEAQMSPETKKGIVSVEQSKHLELECVNVPFKEFKWIVTFAASHDVLGKCQVKLFRFQTEEAEKTFLSIGCLRKLADLMEKLTEEQYLQSDWMKRI